MNSPAQKTPSALAVDAELSDQRTTKEGPGSVLDQPLPPRKDGDSLEGAEALEKKDDYPHGPRLALIIAALLLSMFLIALDMTILATAIPRITEEFNSEPDIGWYAAAFFIGLGIFQSSWGKAYTHFDLKLSFVSSVFLFELGSLICGVARNSNTLIVGRAITGVGGAGVTGGVYTIVAFIVPPAKVPTYVGLVGAVFSIASVAGPLLGGVFASDVTWRWCFYLNLPVGGLALLILAVVFRTPAAVKPVPIKGRNLLLTMDIPGLTLGLGALTSFTLAMHWGGVSKTWSSGPVVGTLVTSGVLTLLFGLVQGMSGDNALLVTRILKQRTTAAVSAFVFFLNAANFSLIYNLPLYFQIINGVSAKDSGIRNLPLILASSLTSLCGGHVLGRLGFYQVFLTTGAALLMVGAGLVYTLDATSSIGQIIGYQILVGLGVGTCIQVPVTAAQAFSAPEDIAMTTAVVLFSQLVSGAIWVAVSQAVLNNSFAAALAAAGDAGLDPAAVLAVGASDLRSAFAGETLEHILQAYMVGLKNSWALSIGLAGLTFLTSFAAEWKSVKGHAVAGMA